MRKRPRHLRTRFANPVSFGDEAVLIRIPLILDDYNDWTEGAPVETDIKVATHPFSEEQMKHIEFDGERREGARYFWTETPVNAADINRGHISDQIKWRGDLFRVFNVEPWEGHYEVHAAPEFFPSTELLA